MIKLSLTFAFLFGVLICFGQTAPDTSADKLDKDTSMFKDRPLYLLKLSQLVSMQTTNLVVNANDIDSINIFKYPQAENEYGKSGNNGVIVVVLKPGIKLMSFDELLTAFRIVPSESNLPVFIDSAIAYQPKKTYFELVIIKNVKIEKEKSTGMRYISIHSIYPIHRRTKGGIILRGSATDIK